jgi:hypothetical protein
MSRADSSDKHLGESLCHLGFIAAVVVEDLSVELAFPVSWHLDLLDSTRRSDQITGVGTIAIAFALGAAFSPSHADERIELLAHHCLQHHTNGSSRQFA